MRIRRDILSVCPILSFVLLSLCGLLGPARARANDLQSGDVLIGASNTNGSGGGILLVRNGTISVFCQSPLSSSTSGYFIVPIAVIADSQGRVVFLAEVNAAPGTALLRCDGIGATPEILAFFPSTSRLAPGYAVPVIPGVLDGEKSFNRTEQRLQLSRPFTC